MTYRSNISDIEIRKEGKNMDSKKYVILRSSEILPPARGDIGRAHRAEMFPMEAAQPIVKLEYAELTKRESNDLRRDPRTLAIAKPMPMKLIAPVGSPDAPTATKSWGIDAVRASESPFDGTGVTVACWILESIQITQHLKA